MSSQEVHNTSLIERHFKDSYPRTCPEHDRSILNYAVAITFLAYSNTSLTRFQACCKGPGIRADSTFWLIAGSHSRYPLILSSSSLSMMSSQYPFWLGGIAASMAASCTHPLDVTKVRMQTSSSTSGAKRPSTLLVIRTSITHSGFRSLYVGLSASLMRQMSYSLVRLGAYEKMKGQLAQQGKSSTPMLLLAASVAGGLGGIAGNPADIILVRMTSDLVRPAEKRYNYPNAISGLIDLIRKEGAKGLSRGLGTNVSRAVLMNMSQVGSYDFVKTTLLQHPIPIVEYKFHDSLPLHLVSSCLAGMFATTVCSPADVMRSRLMASSSMHTSFTNVVTKSFKEEGVRFLFKGWTPSFVRLGPNTVFMFVFYEQLKKLWASSF